MPIELIPSDLERVVGGVAGNTPRPQDDSSSTHSQQKPLQPLSSANQAGEEAARPQQLPQISPAPQPPRLTSPQ
jgi:hypothetical protein